LQVKKTRQVVDFTQNWKFKINDTIVAGSSKNLDDSKWRTLNLPHDWSVESDFGKIFLLLQAAELCPAGLAGIVKLSPSTRQIKVKRFSLSSMESTATVKFGSTEPLWVNVRMVTFRSGTI